ncbi:RNA-binding protein 34-like isoform X1 [Oopsacas minuta]|uniref:RNA-binding protein 34-like isoform X1 n=1 Tax=Oopsacas minuta TaxID=111878 RepID=A0AAV7JWC4_9METZ|nr:RNA-binding protein 34-like isoform X1 [Oopsacas minuta]
MSELAKHFKKSTNDPPTFESFSLPKQQKSKHEKPSSNKQISEESIESDESEDESGNMVDRSEQDKYTIYVGNLPTTYNVKKLTKLFKEIGEVQSARIRAVSTSKAKIPAHMVLKHKMPSVKSLYGYVVFTKIKHTEKAVTKLNGQLVAGRHINVDLCGKNEKKDFKTTVFVSNLHSEVDEEKLWEFFADCGNVVKAHIVTDRVTGESKKFGFVTFKGKSDLILALKKHGEEFQGRNLVVRKANAKHKNIDSSKKRFVHKTPKNAYNRKNAKGYPERPSALPIDTTPTPENEFSTSCGGLISGYTGAFSYSVDTHRSNECQWLIHGPLGYNIRLVVDMNIPGSYRNCINGLEVVDGHQIFGYSHGNYCGDFSDYTFLATHNYMLVKMHVSDRSAGAQFTAEFVANDIDDCRLYGTLCQNGCLNLPGGFTCLCNDGYYVSRNNRTCFGKFLV